MKILYCHDNFYLQNQDGIVYSPGQFPYSYWEPYLDAFGALQILGRGQAIDPAQDLSRMNVSNGPRVSFTLFPNINSPLGLIRHYASVNRRIKKIVAECDGVIIRAVSDLGWLVYNHAKAMGKPITMEMAACAWDSTWNHGNKLGKIYAPVRYIRDKTITANADFVLYVSQKFLQDRYPTNGDVVFASNVRIDPIDDNIIDRRLSHMRLLAEEGRVHRIGLIGNMGSGIKGVADAIEALAILQREKPGAFVFRHLGPGDPAPFLQQAQRLGIGHLVRFDGMIQSGQAVLEWLDNIDIYIQPSYQEGVPRATIEAMSRGCPVIGSTAGGIPELLAPQWLHRPGDVKKLAELMVSMLDCIVLQIDSAGRNVAMAKNFTSEVLMPKRQEFWKNYASFVRKKMAAPEQKMAAE
jgi:glycosyltransferase involved in cell wall biosynthesis